MHDDVATPSTRPYLLRALHEWCSDHGLTPYLAVQVDASVQVPMAFVQDGHIVLNAGYEATSGLHMGNDYISFKARFGGKPHDIMVPVGRVVAIYARETGQGMSFPPEDSVRASDTSAEAEDAVADAKADVAANRPAPVVHLVPHAPEAPAAPNAEGAESVVSADAADEPDEPEPAPPAGSVSGKRPVFKRIK